MHLSILVSESTQHLHTDDHMLPKAFAELGIDCSTHVWTRFSAKPNERVLFRTVWDYTQKQTRFEELLFQLESMSAVCSNPVPTLRWNLNKGYLLELQNLGMPIPETEIHKNFKASDLPRDQGELVCKPCVGASGVDTLLSSSPGFDNALLSLEGREVLVQRYVPEIVSHGEISMIFFAGQFSHAVVKTPKSGEFRIQEEHGGTTRPFQPDHTMLKQAGDLVARLPVEQHYCRLDVVPATDGLVIMEVELIEPSFYFSSTSPDAVRKLCQAVVSSWNT